MEIKQYLRENLFLLSIVGLWPFVSKNYSNIYKIFATCSLMLFGAIHAFFQIVNYFFVYNDLTLVASSLSLFGSCILALTKAFSFFAHVPNTVKLLKQLDDKIFEPKNEAQEAIVRGFLEIWKKIFLTLLVSSLFTASLIGGFKVFMSSKGIRRLPFPAWYPFDYLVTPNYEIVCSYQIISTTFLVIVTINVDVFVAAIMTYVAAFCRILCDDLRNINNHGIMDNENEWNERFANCIQLHQKILKFAKDGNHIMDAITMWQFFITVVGYCTSMFQLSILPPTTFDFYLVIMYQGCLTVEVLMYCWFGHQVLTESEKIPYAIYESDWTPAPLEFKKNMVVFICRANRTLRFLALDFFALSLATFTTILKSSWSYSALLRQIKD